MFALILFACSSVAAAGEGQPLDAKLLDLDGEKLRLADLRGTPVLLELWATWCLPCAEQSRVVEDLADEFAAREVAVYAVNVGEKRETVEEHLERNPSANRVLLDRLQTISTRLEIAELPALVLLASDGTVTATAVGLTDGDAVLAMLNDLAPSSQPPGNDLTQ